MDKLTHRFFNGESLTAKPLNDISDKVNDIIEANQTLLDTAEQIEEVKRAIENIPDSSAATLQIQKNKDALDEQGEKQFELEGKVYGAKAKERVGGILSTKTWTASKSMSFIAIDVKPNDKIIVKKNTDSFFCFLKSVPETITGSTPADISDIDYKIYQNTDFDGTSPDDAKYLFVRTFSNNVDVTPLSILVNGYDVLKSVDDGVKDVNEKVNKNTELLNTCNAKLDELDEIRRKSTRKIDKDTINATILQSTNKWSFSSSTKSCFIQVNEGDVVSYSLGLSVLAFLKDNSCKSGDTPHYSDAEGFTGLISGSGEAITPTDTRYICVRLINKNNNVTPSRLLINGVDCVNSIIDIVDELHGTEVVYASSCSNVMAVGDKFVNNHLGVQIHCTRESQKNILPQIIDYCEDCNASLIRGGLTPELYPYYAKGNLILGSAHSLTNNGVATLNYPTNVGNNFEETFSQWAEGFAKLVQMYDGTLRDEDDVLCLKYNGEPISMKIDYWEGFNELDLNMSKYNLSPQQALRIIRRTYEIAHQYNKDAKVLNGGLASLKTNDNVQSLFDVVDGDNKHFWHYIDIFNFHLYAYNAKLSEIITATKTRLVYWFDYTRNIDNRNNLAKKPLWITELGDTMYVYSADEQAIRVVHWMANVFSIGVDKCSYYQLLGLPENDRESEKYFGLLDHSDNTAETIEIKPSFIAYRVFSELYDIGSSKISIVRDGELNVASWQMANGAGCFALFTNTNTTQQSVVEYPKVKCKIDVQGEYIMAFDYIGNAITLTSVMEIDSHPIYIKGVNMLKYRIL